MWHQVLIGLWARVCLWSVLVRSRELNVTGRVHLRPGWEDYSVSIFINPGPFHQYAHGIKCETLSTGNKATRLLISFSYLNACSLERTLLALLNSYVLLCWFWIEECVCLLSDTKWTFWLSCHVCNGSTFGPLILGNYLLNNLKETIHQIMKMLSLFILMPISTVKNDHNFNGKGLWC